MYILAMADYYFMAKIKCYTCDVLEMSQNFVQLA